MKEIIFDRPQRWKWSLGKLECNGFDGYGCHVKAVSIERRKGGRWVIRVDGRAVFGSTNFCDLLITLAYPPVNLLPHDFIRSLQDSNSDTLHKLALRIKAEATKVKLEYAIGPSGCLSFGPNLQSRFDDYRSFEECKTWGDLKKCMGDSWSMIEDTYQDEGTPVPGPSEILDFGDYRENWLEAWPVIPEIKMNNWFPKLIARRFDAYPGFASGDVPMELGVEHEKEVISVLSELGYAPVRC
jgi:hypothetical protein